MTKVPFDWNVLLRSNVVVHLPTLESTKEFERELDPSIYPLYRKIGDLHKFYYQDQTCIRFMDGVATNYGSLPTYDDHKYDHYLFMVYDGSTNYFPEVGDLI